MFLWWPWMDKPSICKSYTSDLYIMFHASQMFRPAAASRDGVRREFTQEVQRFQSLRAPSHPLQLLSGKCWFFCICWQQMSCRLWWRRMELQATGSTHLNLLSDGGLLFADWAAWNHVAVAPRMIEKKSIVAPNVGFTSDKKNKTKPCSVKLHLLLVAGNQQVSANQPWLNFLEL